MVAAALLWAGLLSACDKDSPMSGLDQDLLAHLEAFEVVALEAPAPGNPAQAELGRMLFFDKILSGNRNISCATCHTPHFATGDGLPLAIGEGGEGLGPNRRIQSAQIIPRNAPGVFGRRLLKTQFFDGRVRELEDGSFVSPGGEALPGGLEDALAVVAMFPVTDRAEMRGQPGNEGNELALRQDSDLAGIWIDLTKRILDIPEYVELIQAAYPGVENLKKINFVHMANALSVFQGNAFSALDSRFDDYLEGDLSALSDREKRGGILFFGQAQCGSCHRGPLLTDESFHNRLVPQLGPGKGHGESGDQDFGLEGFTGKLVDRFKFRTPPLRNVAITGPWFHSGAFATLEAAVRHELDCLTSVEAYAPGQLEPRFASLYHPEHTADIMAGATERETAVIALTEEEIEDLLAFLRSLTSKSAGALSALIPHRVPSGLPVTD